MRALHHAITEFERACRMPDEVRRATFRRANRLKNDLLQCAPLHVKDALIGGSFAKGVETIFTDDLDIYLSIMFTGKEWQGLGQPLSPDAVLNRLYELLSDMLWAPQQRGRVSLRAQRHSVGLRYTETAALSYDIVPLAHRPGNPSWVELPRRGARQWVRTSLRRQLELFGERAAAWPGLRGAIRLLKVWLSRLPPVSEGRQWSAYSLEVMGMAVCQELATGASPGLIFIEVLRWIEATRMRVTVDLARWRTPGFSPSRVFAVHDPAYGPNDLTPTPAGATRRYLTEAASYTLAKLSSLARPDVDTVRDVLLTPSLTVLASAHVVIGTAIEAAVCGGVDAPTPPQEGLATPHRDANAGGAWSASGNESAIALGRPPEAA